MNAIVCGCRNDKSPIFIPCSGIRCWLPTTLASSPQLAEVPISHTRPTPTVSSPWSLTPGLTPANGAVAIVVCVDDADDALADLACIAREQQSARGKFPGPCTVLQRGGGSGPGGHITSAAEVAAAKDAGAAGVVLHGGAAALLPALLAAARAAGLEALVEVADEAQAAAARAAGADVLAVPPPRTRPAPRALRCLAGGLRVL
jgi:hypothetical protein